MNHRAIFSRATKVLGWALVGVGLSKMIAVLGHAQILTEPNPIIPLSNRGAYALAAGLELMVGTYSIASGGNERSALLMGWLGLSLLTYRVGLWWADYVTPCGCLGFAGDILHISPNVAELVTNVLIAMLLVVSAYRWFIRAPRSVTAVA